MKKPAIKVLIVDDSAVIRGLLTRGLQFDPEIEVVGSVMHGEAALGWLKNDVADVVILDVEMPVMDGLETLQEIRQRYPQLPVVMVSNLTQSGAKITMLALSLGASACIAKPQAISAAAAITTLTHELVPLIKGLVNKPFKSTILQTKAAQAIPPPLLQPRSVTEPPQLLVIGSSTGGPNALNRVLCDLGANFSTPTLIVQHMPQMFTAIMANHLQHDTGRCVKEAEDGEFLQPGVTYIAPGNFHLQVRRYQQKLQIELNQLPEEHYCRPSVNPLFRTAAQHVQSQILAVILTGMGSDGLEGTREIVNAGGHVIAQDEASSVVWGMPGSIVNAGLAHEVLPLEEIGSRILKLCKSPLSPVKATS